MKKKLAYLLLAFALPVFLLSGSNLALNQVKPLLEVLQNRYGDTYRLCNLRAYKEEVALPAPYTYEEAPEDVHLTLIGDSYSFKIHPTAYRAKSFTHSTWRRPIPEPDPSQARNILVLETTERFTRERLGDITHFLERKRLSEYETRWEKLEKVYVLNNEDNLQSISFMDPLSLWLREMKASINQKWFGRIDENVAISNDGTHLYIQETIDSTLATSAFKFLSDDELDMMVENANSLYAFALQMGYDEVYFSVIPNKVTVMDRQYQGMDYNGLIPRLEQNSSLQWPLIKILDWIKAEHYYLGDTHWNFSGSDIWVKQVNAVLNPKKGE